MQIHKNKCYKLFCIDGKNPGNSEELYVENGIPVGDRRRIDGQSIIRARNVVCRKYFGIIGIEGRIANVVINGQQRFRKLSK